MTGPAFPSGDLLLAAALVACAAGLAGSVQAVRRRRAGWEAAAYAAAAGATMAAFVDLALRFLTSDLTTEAVFFYSRSDLAWPWKLAGTWSGREGSLLLWTTAMAVVLFLVTNAHRRRGSGSALGPGTVSGAGIADELRMARAWTRLWLGLGTFAFLAAALSQSPFGATDPALLAGRPLGNGLNPTLKSGFILIHPPIMFAAYALAAVPAAAALGDLCSRAGNGAWSRVATGWTRAGWLLATIAMGLGAMWAYTTLGFGGYWAWDPVEVANLLPWLAFTVLLHALLHHRRHGSYPLAAPMLAVLPLAMTLFSTISTRSGLWVSVHAFTDPTDTFNPDAQARILDILRVETGLGFYVGLALAILALALAFWSRRLATTSGRLATYSRIAAALLAAYAAYAVAAPASALSLVLQAGSFVPIQGLLAITFTVVVLAGLPALVRPATADDATKPRTARGLARIDLRSLNATALVLLALALLVLLLFHFAAVNGWSSAFYEARFPYLAAPVLLGILVFQGHQAFGRRRSLVVAAVALATAVAAQLVWQGHRGGPFLLVLSVASLGVAALRVRRAAQAPGTPRRVRRADAVLATAALLDVLFWANPPTVRLGVMTWQPGLGAQAVLLVLSIVALVASGLVLAGVPLGRRGLVAALVAAPAGFYLAIPLAVAWLAFGRGGPALDRRARTAIDAKARARIGQAALHGVHAALVLAVVGYAASTYFQSAATQELHAGESLSVGGRLVTLHATTVPGTGPVEAFTVDLDVAGHGGGALHPPMAWEDQAAAHYPLPAIHRTWDRDLYTDLEAVHVTGNSTCLSGYGQAWYQAYEVGLPARVCGGDTIDAVRVKAVDLPGLGLLWLALIVGSVAMAAMMWAGRPQRSRA